jgi:threonine dehydratase
MKRHSQGMCRDIKDEVLKAQKRIRRHIRETPVDCSPYLGRLANCRLYLKLENTQITGSFKLRGALNKFLSLGQTARQTKMVTASSGNHAAAFAYILQKFGGQGVIYLPENASPAKIEALRLTGAELRLYGSDCIQSELLAKKTAAETGQLFIAPYNDRQIIGGQGTIGLELIKQIEKIDSVLVPVGGGGLISGIAGYLKAVNAKIEIIGCQPENSPVMYASIRAGRIQDIESKPTLADGTAGGIDPEAMTFEICKKLVDDFILVSESEIKDAIRLIIDKHQLLIEGAAALSVAAFIKKKERFRNRNVVLIISGKKISLDQLKAILRG